MKVMAGGSMKEPTRQEKLGIMFADCVIEAAHQKYNAPGGIAMVKACIKRLQERIGEIQPRKADPEYKKARYSKKRSLTEIDIKE